MRSLHLTLAAAAALPLPSLGQDCACAPSSYDFALDFSGTCDDGVGLAPGSPGLEGSVCFYTRGGSPEDLEDGDVQFGAPSRRRLASPPGVANDARRLEWRRALEDLDLAAQRSHAEGVAAARRRRTQEEGGGQWRQDDVAPTVVTSVTFLEADSTPSLNIINQDSTYFEGEYADGEVLSYDSISAELDPSVPLSDQIDKLPGGVMLVLFGVNSASEVVQNTVAWGYNLNDCDDEPLSDGDGVGWVRLSSYSPPMPEFCPAVTASPTAGPTNAPTDPPVATTTTAAPPMSMSLPDSDPCDAKSGKGSKSGLFAKSSKTAKSLDEAVGDAKAAKVYPKGEGASCKSAKVHVEPAAKSAKVMAKSAKSSSAEMLAKSAKSVKSTKAKSQGETTVEAKSAKSEEASTPFAKSAKSEEMSTPLAKSSKSGGLDAKAGSSSKAAKVHATASAKAAKAAGPDASAKSVKTKSVKTKSVKTKSVKTKSAKSASGMMSAPHGKAEKESKSHKGDAKAVKASDDGASAKSAKAKSAKADSAGMMSVGKSEKAKSAKAADGKSAKAEPATVDAKATKMSDHSKSAKVADAVSASQGYHEVVARPGE